MLEMYFCDDRIMIRIRDPRYVVGNGLVSVRIKHIVDSEHRPQKRICGSETITGLNERILSASGHAVICI